ncbi:MAG: hypothetical protein HC892_05040 [Saprospiraceae bacterium]|nr:hypothetical protein [Saprospiraceae bacterium]
MFNKYHLTFFSLCLRIAACFLLLGASPTFLFAQLDLARLKVDWQKAGVITDSLPSYDNIINVTDFRLVGDGITPNDLYFKQLLARYEGKPTIFYFPAGKYLFLSPINLSDYFILKGESARETKLIFDLKGKFRNCINAIGSVNTSVYTVKTDVLQWSKDLSLDRTDGLKVGDMVLLTSEDSNLVESEWAKKSTGQISTIDSVGTQMIVFREVVRRTHPKTYFPQLHVIRPIKGVGIECLSVERKDATPFQTTNIYFKYAMNCWVSGVEGNKCNYTHVEFRSSYHLSLLNSYFHDAFDYGDGGKGYGVLVHFNSSLCLVENNIFEQLRHSMVLQAGANGNVIGYNHSRNVYWENEQGTDRAGDLVLHGNYPYANLLESNVVQNIIIDDSHGMNGIYNLFTRNRAESYGIFVSTTFPPTPEQIFDGNETTNLEDGYGRYGIFGYHWNLAIILKEL